MIIKQNLVSSSKYDVKCPYKMNVQYITFHNTDNDAPAKNEVAYMISNDKQVSFHVAVDDVEAIQGIPFDRNAWHCGDGNGKGNRSSIGVEICYNSLGSNNAKFKKAEDNAVEVCAKLLKDNGLGIDRLKPHKFWSGKNCPSTTNHSEFIKRVQVKLNELNTPTKKHYENCVLYGNDVDRVAAEIISWYKKDCIFKHVNDHVIWEGSNLFVVGGDAEKAMIALNNGEKYGTVLGKDRADTVRKCLEFVGK